MSRSGSFVIIDASFLYYYATTINIVILRLLNNENFIRVLVLYLTYSW